MSKENEIELLLNSEFSIDEVKSKIDNNITTFGYVFIYLSQKLINMLENLINDSNKINEFQIKKICSTMKKLKMLSLIYKNNRNDFNQEKINGIIEKLILICNIFVNNNQYEKYSNLFYSEQILRFLFGIHPEESSYFIHCHLNLRNILFVDLFKQKQLRNDIGNIISEIILNCKSISTNEKNIYKEYLKDMLFVYYTEFVEKKINIEKIINVLINILSFFQNEKDILIFGDIYLNIILKLLEEYTNENKIYYENFFKTFSFISFKPREIMKNNNNDLSYIHIDIFLQIFIRIISINNEDIKLLFLNCFFFNIDSSEKYNILVNKTKYKEYFLKLLPNIKDTNILSIYFQNLINLYTSKNSNLIPEIDLKIIFENLKSYLQNQNNEVFSLINCQLYSLVSGKSNILGHILTTKFYSDKIEEFIEDNEFSEEFRLNILSFFEKLYAYNQGNIQMKSFFNIIKGDGRIIKLKNWMALEYETNISDFNKKITCIIDICESYFVNNEQIKIIRYLRLILKSLNAKRFIDINKLENLTINTFNNFLLKFAQNFNENDSNNIKKFLKLLFKSIFGLNRRIMEYNLLSKREGQQSILFYSNHIIKKEIFESIIDNFLNSNQGMMKIVYDYLLNIAILDDKIIISPHIIKLIIKLLFKNSNWNQLKILISLLNELFDYFEINIKTMLFHNFLLLIMNIYYQITDGTEFKEIILSNLSKFIKYISRYHLEKYFFKIYKNIINYKNNYTDFNYENSVLKKLFEFVNKNITESKNETLNCIYFSKQTYFNPLIYNMINIDNINIPNDNNYLTILMYMKILSYDNIDGFQICKIITKNKQPSTINIQITKNKELIIREDNSENIYKIDSFNNHFKNDGKYHSILIEFDFKNNNLLKFSIDNNLINEFQLKIFKPGNLDINIGFSGYGLSRNNDIFLINENKNPISIISLSYILIYNKKFENDEIKRIEKRNIEKGKNLRINDLLNETINRNLKNNILTEISFNFQNIKLIEFENLSENIKDTIKKKSFINSSENLNYYISYIDFINFANDYNPFTKIFLFSVNDNILNYLSINKRVKLENIYIEKIYYKFFITFGIDLAINNNFFPQLIMGFLYELDGLNEFYNCKNIIFELLKSLLPNENFYEFLKNDNELSLQFRIYFEKNIETFNLIIIDLLKKLLELKNDIGENIILLSLYSNILTNPFIFDKIKNKKEILNYLTDLLSKSKLLNNQNLNILFQILYNICIYLFYYEIKENNEEALKDIYISLINCTTNILELIKKYGSESLIVKTNDLFFFTSSNYNNLKSKISSHKGEIFYKKYPNLDLNNDFLNSLIIRKQLKECFEKMSIQFALNENNIRYNDECQFCAFLFKYIDLNWSHLLDLLYYEKNKKQYYINAFQNHKKYKSNEKINSNYAWYLSSKEGMSRIMNQFIMKENDIIDYTFYNEYKKKNYKKYEYSFYNKYQEFYMKLNKILIYSNLLEENESLIENIRNGEFKNSYRINCLLFKRIQKTNSLLILNEKFLYILGNIFEDNKGIIHICKGELKPEFWAKPIEKVEKELNEYIKKSEDYYLNLKIEDLNKTEEKSDPRNIKFNYDYNYKPYFIKISLKNISEIYQRDFLHVDNAIEIFLKNGSSYFIIFNRKKREEVFKKIITNINNIYKKQNMNIKTIHNFTPETKITKQNFYMRHYPNKILTQSKNKEKLYLKNLSNIQEFLSYCSKNWKTHKITNFDYLILLNTLANRTYNVLSQYFIFPWIILDFPQNSNKLDIFQKNLYRDLSYPIFVQSLEAKEDLEGKYLLRDEDAKYHSGTIFSTHAFINYFNIRQRPFTECSLAIQGGEFDVSDRLFIGKNQLTCSIEKFLELIPSIYTIPEIFINFNNFDLGLTQNNNLVDDFYLPDFFKNDPRFFTLVKKKLLENKKVSENINNWIDLVFGYKQNGEEAIKFLNTYRGDCSKFSEGELDRISDYDLNMKLTEKSEFGCFPEQLFNKKHIKKDKCYWINKTKVFFDSDEKVEKFQINRLEKINFNLKNCKIQINDFEIFDNNSLINNNQYFLGGISSIFTVMNSLSKKENTDNIDEIFNPQKSYVLLGKNCFFCNKNKDKYITFHNNILSIVNINDYKVFDFHTNELSNITALASSFNGKKIFVGFHNGNIIEYNCLKNPENSNDFLDFKVDSISKIDNEFILLNKEKFLNKLISFKTIFIKKTNKCFNYPKYPISKIKYNEAYNILIISDISNTIYILSPRYKKLKLIHVVKFLTGTKFLIKDILPIYSNGDFIVYTKFTVYLFSINGVPLCELNLFKSSYELYPIIYANASFVGDCTLFLSHQDGKISFWIIIDKNIKCEKHNRYSINNYNDNKEKILNDYRYAYNDNSKIKNNEDRKLMRFFNLVHLICHPKKIPFIFMKINDEKNYMLLIDKEYNFFYLISVLQKKTSMFQIFKSKLCSVCEQTIQNSKKNLITLGQSNDKSNQKENILVCEKCRNSLTNGENILYN